MDRALFQKSIENCDLKLSGKIITDNEKIKQIIDINEIKQKEKIPENIFFNTINHKNVIDIGDSTIEDCEKFVGFKYRINKRRTIVWKDLKKQKNEMIISTILSQLYAKSWEKVEIINFRKKLFSFFQKDEELFVDLEKYRSFAKFLEKKLNFMSSLVLSSIVYSSYRQNAGFCTISDDLSLVISLLSLT